MVVDVTRRLICLQPLLQPGHGTALSAFLRPGWEEPTLFGAVPAGGVGGGVEGLGGLGGLCLLS